MTYKTKITTLGLAKIATAIASGTALSITTMKLGDGNGNPVEDPDVNATTLVRTVWTGTLSYIKADPVVLNRYIAEAVVPYDIGGWTVREVGLFDSDGDLIAISNFPDIYKPTVGEGAVRDLVVRIYFEVVNGTDVTIEFDPSVIVATRNWVGSNFSLAALLPGGTTHQVLRKKSNSDGDVEWYDPASALNIIVDVVEELQTLAALQTVVNLTTATTDGAAYYVSGHRLNPTEYTVNSATQITLAASYAAGSKILICQNEPSTGLTFLRSAQNLADVPDKEDARVNLGLLSDSTYLDALWKLLNQRQYPIGEIFTTRQSGNPSAILGFGTWVRHGSGRVMVSLDEAEPAFNTVDKTGGAATHTLTLNEIPGHTHSVTPPSTATSSNGSHAHYLVAKGVTTNAAILSTQAIAERGLNIAGDNYDYFMGGTASKAPDAGLSSNEGAHTHTLNISEFASGSSGNGQSHNNLQPFIVVNVWRRTA